MNGFLKKLILYSHCHRMQAKNIRRVTLEVVAVVLIILSLNCRMSSTWAGQEIKNKVEEFSVTKILRWNEKSFVGRTSYTEDSGSISASCDDSASGLFLKRKINLRDTPIIEWSWRVGSNFDVSIDQTTKKGDDFAARIYVVKETGLLPWDNYAINYVWASSSQKGASWPNPFVKQVKMVVVRSGPPNLVGRLITERRNLIEDFQYFHGLAVDTIDGVALMTDCDNGHGKARAWYGPISFLSE